MNVYYNLISIDPICPENNVSIHKLENVDDILKELDNVLYKRTKARFLFISLVICGIK